MNPRDSRSNTGRSSTGRGPSSAFLPRIVLAGALVNIASCACDAAPATSQASYEPAWTHLQLEQVGRDPALDPAGRASRRAAVFRGLSRQQFVAYARYATARIGQLQVRMMVHAQLLREYTQATRAQTPTDVVLREIADPALPVEFRFTDAVHLAGRDLQLDAIQTLAQVMLALAADPVVQRDGLAVEVIWQTELVLQKLQRAIAPQLSAPANKGRNGTIHGFTPDSYAPEHEGIAQQITKDRQELLRIAQGLPQPAQIELGGRIDWMNSVRRSGNRSGTDR